MNLKITIAGLMLLIALAVGAYIRFLQSPPEPAGIAQHVKPPSTPSSVVVEGGGLSKQGCFAALNVMLNVRGAELKDFRVAPSAKFKVDQSGQRTDITLVRSSGSFEVDQNLALQIAAPRALLARECGQATVTITPGIQLSDR